MGSRAPGTGASQGLWGTPRRRLRRAVERASLQPSLPSRGNYGGDDDGDSDSYASPDDHLPLPPFEEPRAAGPETYEETLETVRFIVGRIFEVMGSSMDEPWGEVAEKGIILTTDYSGSGCAELAMAFVEEHPVVSHSFVPSYPGGHETCKKKR